MARCTTSTLALASTAAIGAGAGLYYYLTYGRRDSPCKIANAFKGRSLLSVRQLAKADVVEVMRLAQRCKDVVLSRGTCNALRRNVLGLLFYEPSTRTRCSFEAAMKRLGGQVVSIIDPASSSVRKGEVLDDTARMLSNYCDLLVIRHPVKGACEKASEASNDKPVINAGDGDGEHPTQALLDLFTILQFFPPESTKTLTVTFAGDLKYGRTVHSLAPLLAMFDVKFRYVAPDVLQCPDDLRDTVAAVFERHDFNPEGRQIQSSSLDDMLRGTDILYMTRIQEERLPDSTKVQNYLLTVDQLERLAPTTMKVMHPLPRLEEIPLEVDENHRAAYFEQAQNGLYVRMAILAMALGKAHKIHD